MKRIQTIIVSVWFCYILQAIYFFILTGSPVILSGLYLVLCTLVCGMLLNATGYKGGV